MQIKVLYNNVFFSTVQSPNNLDFLLSLDDSMNTELLTLDQADYQAWAKKHFSEFATRARKAVIGNADPYKISGWSNKEARAHRVNASTATAADLTALQDEINQRGKNETVAELVAKQLNKAELFAKIRGRIDGLEDKIFDQIDATTTNAELDALIALRDPQAETFLANLLTLVV